MFLGSINEAKVAEAGELRGMQKEASHSQLCLTLELHIIHKRQAMCQHVACPLCCAAHLTVRIHAQLTSRSPVRRSTEVNTRVVPRQNDGELEDLSAPSCPHKSDMRHAHSIMTPVGESDHPSVLL